MGFTLYLNGKKITLETYNYLTMSDKQKVKKYPFFKTYFLYNLEQTTIKEPIKNTQEIKPIEQADKFLTSYRECPKINFLGNQPYYTAKDDTIQIPAIDKFTTAEEYYSTLFHELTHSTGHEKRLNRESMKKYSLKDHTKNVEELTAEIGSGFLASNVGIEKTITNNIAYCQSWYEAIKDNKKLLTEAIKQASNSYKFILEHNHI